MGYTLETVETRLLSFGYTFSDQSADEVILTFCMDKVKSSILNDINWAELPTGLIPIAIDMVVGEFLKSKMVFAPDDISSLDLSGAATQIKLGDTTVNFGSSSSGISTDEEKLTAFIDYLLSYGKSEFGAFRRIRWS